MSELTEIYAKLADKLCSTDRDEDHILERISYEMAEVRKMMGQDEPNPEVALQKIDKICDDAPQYDPEDFLSYGKMSQLSDALDSIADITRHWRS